ncbi:MAG: adenylate/guanylate cyclase domain-containing protein, partial [Pseudomonadota bacterium]
PQTGAVAERYSHSADYQEAEDWERSPFFVLYQKRSRRLHLRIAQDEGVDRFPLIAQFQSEGATDYLAIRVEHTGKAAIGGEDAAFISFATNKQGGFTLQDIRGLERLAPCLTLSERGSSAARIVRTVATTYMGKAASQRVMAGQIVRGQAERMSAVLWFSDLRDYTRTADAIEPEKVIPFLNDHVAPQVEEITAQGGNVVKLVGDGVLALFPINSPPDTPEVAGRVLAAAARVLARMDDVTRDRLESGEVACSLSLGLHVGDVYFGNVGGLVRLDFTVIGPAVNETARIEGMSRALDQKAVVSERFAETLVPSDREKLVALGRYALRGVRRPQQLYALDPDFLSQSRHAI